MTDNKTIDYTTYFEFPTLPRIHGEPTYEQLKDLKDKLKTNAAKITSDLGGGGVWTSRLSSVSSRVRQRLTNSIYKTVTSRTTSNPSSNIRTSGKQTSQAA